MNNKIGTFLMIVLIICAVLMLVAASGRNTQEPGETVGETTVQTTAPSEQTQPQAQQTTESEPEETTEPQTTQPPVIQAPAANQQGRVENILDREKLTPTANSNRVFAPELHGASAAQAHAGDSYGYALGCVAGERAMNPIAAFWELVYEGLYSKEKDLSGFYPEAASMVPEQTAKSYAADKSGARTLMEDLLNLANRMHDELALEQALLEDLGQVHWSQEEECFYAYFTVSSERSTHILCFYLRGEGVIDDVEFQLLNLRHAEGSGEDLIDAAGDRQAASLMAAAELLLTGTHRAGFADVPVAYTVGGATAKIERYTFASTGELGVLTNYRLQK